MFHRTHHLLGLFVLFGAPLLGHAQQATVASGGDASGTGGSISYSIGQPSYTTIASSSASVAQGVQQPYEISVITGLEEHASTISLSAYPNPATDAVELLLGEAPTAGMAYSLHDAGGRLVASGRITTERLRIELPEAGPGVYLLAVQQDGSLLRSFRIVKH